MRRLTILVADPGLRRDLLQIVRASGYAADAADPADVVGAAAGSDAILIEVSTGVDLDLLRALRTALPSLSIIALGSDATAHTMIEAKRAGARGFLRMPFDVSTLEEALAGCERADSGPSDELRFISQDPRVLQLLDEAERAASTDATIRIQGESGTGKGLLARWIHRWSARSTGPYVVVSCAGLSEAFAERELFGDSRTASQPSNGQIVAASGGTLVLDEVSDLSLGVQPRLLRVLQDREVTSLGAQQAEPVDVRVIVTTQRDLEGEVSAGRFREDLYYRLNVIELRVSPLRERPRDIEPLARHLLAQFSRQQGTPTPQLSEAALASLQAHPFRGNVRELENLMRRAAILFAGQPIDVDLLLAQRVNRIAAHTALDTFNLDELARETIRRALVATGGNRTQAARALGISVRTLRNKLRAYGFDARDHSNPAHSADRISS